MKSAEEKVKERILARKESAAYIATNPSLFKLCEGCESILIDSTAICPVCEAYRFNKNPLDILRKAEELASRDQHQLSDEDYE